MKKKNFYGFVVFLTAIGLILGSCDHNDTKPEVGKTNNGQNTTTNEAETFEITVKDENVSDGCYVIIYQAGDTEKAVKKGNNVKVIACVNNLKVNSKALEMHGATDILVESDKTIEITYESNATTETEKLTSDKELVECGHYTILYSVTSEERSNTLKEAVAKRIKHDSTVVSVDLDSDSGIYVAKLRNGSEEKSANLVVAEENNFCPMILIPASGEITLGGGVWSEENPEHKANVKAFKMSETLVTQGLFKRLWILTQAILMLRQHRNMKTKTCALLIA